MHCPFCGHSRTEVYNSRNTGQYRRVWRRRRCTGCEKAFTTYESSDLGFITIYKQRGHQEPYIRSKLLVSLYHACSGLDGCMEMIDALADTVEDGILNLQKTEVKSTEMAELTLSILERFHTSAYLRYLSYRGGLANSAHLKKSVAKLK